ncbi:hypothetical protein [Hyphomonas sp.]|uniref:hypothetical protein n=1 Tax=Hyphomonas sp. TaxID=87 RepID=UPI0025B7E660|nr:hypothetical protein [Hyphomonas sp.]
MIRAIEKFFCLSPLFVALLCTSFVDGSSMDTKEPSPTVKEQTQDCIEQIRKKQLKIKEEILLIKKLIKDTRQNQEQKDRP